MAASDQSTPEAPSSPTVVTVGAPQGRPGRLSRRRVLTIGFWGGVFATLIAAVGGLLDSLYPRKVAGFGGKVVAGKVEDFPAGTKVQNLEGRFWLVSLTEEQGGPGLLALWQKCPHLGCTVPWRDGFVFKDPATGQDTKGWFRCPCHGSTYTNAGVRVWGPAPRSMDTMALTIENGNIMVDTGAITPGSQDNASRVVKV